MDINKELENIFNDPIFDMSKKEKDLLNMPSDMSRELLRRNQPDFYAKRKKCEDFDKYKPLFTKVQQELKNGQRSLVKISRTTNFIQGHYYVVGGQLVYLDKVGKGIKAANGTHDARTRCIYEDGTESNILLQTLRKNVMDEGFGVTENDEGSSSEFFNENDINSKDKVSGTVYVLKSLSDNPEISRQHDLYKIGFTTKSVEERIANAVKEPTYLMAPVRIIATYKIVNMDSHRFETLLHHVLSSANFKFKVTDDNGVQHLAREWYIVPLPVVNDIIRRIMDGSIIGYVYNREQQCLEKSKQ